MSFWTAMVILAGIGALVMVLRSRGITGGGPGDPGMSDDDPERDAREAAAQAEIAELKERIAVLERIATDAHSTDARERARITAEIEALRGTGAPSDPHTQTTQSEPTGAS